jgi:hypothetical protein
MRLLLAGLAGVAAAFCGWLATGAAAVWIAGLFGVSDFEGERGTFAFLFVGPLGGLTCMVAAVWLVLRRGYGAGRPAALGRVALVLAGIAAVAAIAVAVRLRMVDTYTDELPPQLVFEVRLAPPVSADGQAAIDVELQTDRNTAGAVFLEPRPRSEHGAQVVSGIVELARKTSSRILVVSLADGSERLFRLRLSRDPPSTPAFGAWHRPDHLARKGSPDVTEAPADDPVELRWRVRRAGEE